MTGSKKQDVFGTPAEQAQAQAQGAMTPADAAKAASKEEAAAELSRLYAEEKRIRRRKFMTVLVIALVLSVFSLFVDGGYRQLFDPQEVFACYGAWLSNAKASILGGAGMSSQDLLAAHPAYYRVISRVNITLMTVVCGAVLAVAGTLYQSAFRNPIASPSMLGVSSAIQLGNALLVLFFGTVASSYLGMRYLICYVCVIAVTVALFVIARLITGKKQPFNIVNLLLVATILNQLIGVVVNYITYFIFDDAAWEVYNSLSEGISPDLSLLSWAVMLVTFAIGIIPVMMLRFRLNGLNFPDPDMKLLGIQPTKLRMLALVCGTVMLMGAQTQMGTVAMLCLVVPHISRMIFGAEFTKQLACNMILGAALLVLCRDVAGLLPVLGPILPISTILNFVVLPFFVWMLAVQQRGWEA